MIVLKNLYNIFLDKATVIMKSIGFVILGFIILILSDCASINSLLSSVIDKNLSDILSNIFRYVLVTILTLILLFKFAKKNNMSFYKYGINKRKIGRYYLGGLIWGISCIVICAIVFSIQIGGKIYISFSELSHIIFIVLFIEFVFQTFSEELMIRTYIPVKLNEKFSKIQAAFITAMIFGSLHLFKQGSCLFILNCIITGMLLTIIYFDTKSIWVISGWHCGWNFFSAIMFDYKVFNIKVNGEIVSLDLESKIVTTIMLVLSILIWTWYSRVKNNNMKIVENKEVL